MSNKPAGSGFPWVCVPRPGKIYGAARVGERGQIAIPAEARRELGIETGDKMMVFANRINGSLVLVKADVFEGFADFFMTKLNKLEETAQNFFDSFTSVVVPGEEDEYEAYPAEAAEAAADSVKDAAEELAEEIKQAAEDLADEPIEPKPTRKPRQPRKPKA